jgi:hypothetical protein
MPVSAGAYFSAARHMTGSRRRQAQPSADSSKQLRIAPDTDLGTIARTNRSHFCSKRGRSWPQLELW